MKKSFFYLLIASILLLVVNCQQKNTARSPKLVTAADSAGYAIGILVGNNNKQQINNAPGGGDINLEAMTAGFRSASLDEELEMTVEAANSFLGDYFEQASKKAGQENLESGNAFLEQNKNREGVNVTPSGLQYEVLKQGSGEKPDSTDRVRVHYHGTLVDGTVFDSSVDRGEPAVFGVGQVIPGWTEALQMMPVGSKWKIYIPSELAYGERGAGNDIGPNSTLVFDVELLEIVE